MTDCQYCRTPITNPRRGQRFCSEPKRCRTKWSREAGVVSGVRLTKNGWSVTTLFHGLPTVKKGDSIRLQKDEQSRSDGNHATQERSAMRSKGKATNWHPHTEPPPPDKKGDTP